jgi:hypothetical protein
MYISKLFSKTIKKGGKNNEAEKTDSGRGIKDKAKGRSAKYALGSRSRSESGKETDWPQFSGNVIIKIYLKILIIFSFKGMVAYVPHEGKHSHKQVLGHRRKNSISTQQHWKNWSN